MPKAHILYVEDDVNLSFVTRDNLEMAEYAVTHCTTGDEAKAIYKPGQFDVCLLDVMLPQCDGFSVARHIRQQDTQVPILFLSALADRDNRLHGLRLGADDYLGKPFSVEELLLKINVFLRRSAGQQTVPKPAPVSKTQRQLGAFGYNITEGSLTFGDHTQTLTQREAEVLTYLIDRPNEMIRRDDILKAIWGDDDYFMGRSLDVFISRLRKRLAPDASIRIENLHGVGFRLRLNG